MKKIPDIPSLGLVWNTQYFENWIPAIPVLMTWVFIVCDNLELAGSWWLDFWWCLNWFELVLTRSFPKDLDCGEVHFRCLRFWILRVPNKSPENVNYFFVPKKRVCLPLCHYGNLLSEYGDWWNKKLTFPHWVLSEKHNIVEIWIPKFAVDDLTFGGAFEWVSSHAKFP